MAEPETGVAQASKGPTELDVVAPGEEETEIGHKNNNDFERSAIWAASATSGIQREKWGSKMQFLMSCIASAVGLGNVWRFPAICARNGGAAFLIPYIVVLFVIARPLFVLELTLGQFSSKGSVRCWDLSPAFTGIGLTGMASSILLSTFYIMLLAWALIYSVVAFASICYDPTNKIALWSDNPVMFFVEDVIGGVDFEHISLPQHRIASSIPMCHLVLALIFAWMIIWVTMVFGVEASGKVAYVTALAPYVVLIILLGAGLSLEGKELGLEYLFYPDLKKLIQGNTWFQAVGQCFFSLGIGFGGCIMFSSYNEFNNDIIRDVLIISIVDSVTSLLAGVSLMSILGFQATETFNQTTALEARNDNKTGMYKCMQEKENYHGKFKEAALVKELKVCHLEGIIGEGGAGLAFIHYPAAMNKINEKLGAPVGTIFGLLFFLMLILLAVGSANGFVGTTVTIIADKKPRWKRSNIVSGVCAISCIMGLIYTNKIGAEWFDVVDIHGVTAVVYVLAFLEVSAIVYVYGLKNFCDDIQYMRGGKPPGWYLRITWTTLPPIMFGIYIYWLAQYQKPESWTTAIQAVAWLITTGCLLIIPVTMVVKFFQFRRNPWRHNIPLTPFHIIIAIFKPSPRWGPKEPEIRHGWKQFKEGRDSSYHIFGRMRNFWYRVIKKPEPQIQPTPKTSYAVSAFPPNRASESGADSSLIATPETAAGTPGFDTGGSASGAMSPPEMNAKP